MFVQNLFFELIQVAIGEKSCLSCTPSDDDWQALFDLAQSHAIAGVCLAGLEKLSNIGQRPPQLLLLNWIGIAQQIEERNKVVNNQCLVLQKKMSRDGFQSCILKGQGNAEMYGQIIPQLALLRQAGDIDVWVEGGCEKVLKYVEQIAPTEDVNEQHVHFRLFQDTEVEVHFTPSRLSNRWLDRKLQRWFESEQDRQMEHK